MSSFYIFAEREKLPPAANTIFFCTAVATTVGVLLFAPARMLTRAEQTQNNWDWLRQLLFYLALIAIAVWWVAASGIY